MSDTPAAAAAKKNSGQASKKSAGQASKKSAGQAKGAPADWRVEVLRPDGSYWWTYLVGAVADAGAARRAVEPLLAMMTPATGATIGRIELEPERGVFHLERRRSPSPNGDPF